MNHRVRNPILWVPGVQARDLTGNYTLTQVQGGIGGTGAVTYPKGPFGHACIDIDETVDPNSAALQITDQCPFTENDPQTLMCWANLPIESAYLISSLDHTSPLSYHGGLSMYATSGDSYGWRIHAKISNTANANATRDCGFNTWCHVCIVYDGGGVSGGTVTYYVNGEYAGNDTALSGTWTDDTRWTIGAGRGVSNSLLYKCQGNLADIRVYDVALDAEEVGWIARQGMPQAPAVIEPVVHLADITDTTLEANWATQDTVWSAKDRSANQKDMSVDAGQASFDARGGMQCDGSTVYTAGALGLAGGSPQTIIAWVKPSTRGTYVLTTRDGSIGGLSMWLESSGVADWKLAAFVAATKQDVGLTARPLYNWFRCAIVYDGSTLKYYVNGAYDGGDLTPTGTWNATTDTLIGARGDGGGGYTLYWSGVVRDVRVYSRVLSAGEILRDYQQCVPDAGVCRRIHPVLGDISRYAASLTWSNATPGVNGMVTFANGGITWTSKAASGYMYWWDPDDGTGWHHWATDGSTVWQDGAETSDSLPVSVGATGFSGATGTMAGLVVYDRAVTSDDALTAFQREILYR